MDTNIRKEEALNLLLKEPIKNVNILHFIENYKIKSYEILGSSVMVRGRSDKDWVYISSNNEEEFIGLKNKLMDKDIYFAVLEDWMLPLIKANRKVVWILSCLRMFFPDVEVPEYDAAKIKKLTPGDAAYIYENSKYKKFTSVGYIKQRIKSGYAFGIFDKRALVGWLLTHDDGAIGFLNVLEEYRRHGYATDLTYAMIKEMKNSGKIPFIHIEEDNINSMNLAAKMGFEKDRMVHWLKTEILIN